MDLLALAFRTLIRRSVRAGLGGVWLRGAPPAGGAVLAPNHHSWWDGYLMGELAWNLRHPVALMMTARQLDAFPFFRRLGALDPTELRAARRAARRAWLVVFPEGELRAAGAPGPLRPGAAWLARTAGVPLVPVALRVALRGAQRPEAYLRVGAPVTGAALPAALARELAALDRDLLDSDPEAPVAGYLRLTAGRRSDSQRLVGLSRWLARLTGDAA